MVKRTSWATAVLAGGLVAFAGCDDGGNDAADAVAVEDIIAALAEGSEDELALGDPCELVSDGEVSRIVGVELTGSLANVGDGLPGATCSYAVSSGGGLINLNIIPGGAASYDTYLEFIPADQRDEVHQIAGLGDRAYLYERAELVIAVDEALVSIAVLTSEASLDDEGLEIARAAITALRGSGTDSTDVSAMLAEIRGDRTLASLAECATIGGCERASRTQ